MEFCESTHLSRILIYGMKMPTNNCVIVICRNCDFAFDILDKTVCLKYVINEW